MNGQQSWTSTQFYHLLISIPEILKGFWILQKSQNSVYIWLLAHFLTVKVTRLLTSSCCCCSNLFDKFLTSLFRPQNGGSGNRIFWNDRFAFSLRFHPTVGARCVWSCLSDNNPLPLLPSELFLCRRGGDKKSGHDLRMSLFVAWQHLGGRTTPTQETSW